MQVLLIIRFISSHFDVSMPLVYDKNKNISIVSQDGRFYGKSSEVKYLMSGKAHITYEENSGCYPVNRIFMLE